jgi:hypothetical protein
MPYCEYCGEEVESDCYDLDQYDHKHYICDASSCHMEFHRDLRAEDEERRYRAAEDDYQRY